jgi:lipopolysaccharide exporter
MLSPEDFAVVAVTTLVVMFIEVFTNTGSEQYSLSRSSVSRQKINSAWTLDLFIKLQATIIIVVIAYPASIFYGNFAIFHLILAMALLPLINGLHNPGLWRLKRQQYYPIVISILLISTVIGAISIVSITILYRSYSALIIGQLLTTFTNLFLSFLLCKYRPSLSFRCIKQQLNVSSFIVGQEVFGYFKANLDSFFVSKYYYASIFGHFYIMKYISVIPALNIMILLAEPLLVEMSKKQQNANHQCLKYSVT